MRSCVRIAMLVTALVFVACAPQSAQPVTPTQAAPVQSDGCGDRLRAAEEQHRADGQKFDDALKQIEDLKQRLAAVSGSAAASGAEKAQMAQALDEYKLRGAQLEEIARRTKDLRRRLDALTKIGITIVARRNRLMISIPGDVLFKPGIDVLTPEGEQVLQQVAAVIAGDATLKQRAFQVTGHHDNASAKDALLVSYARARAVLLLLIAPAPKGGGLDPMQWSAATYGANDPVAGTVTQQSDDDRKRNRRVELVIQPSADEMLNLNNL
jgi:chemotaxis protein MotB